MKKILIIHTGGTIGSASEETRTLSGESVKQAKRLLLTEFEKSDCGLGCEIFEDADYPEELTTLSESMTPEVLYRIAEHLRGFDFKKYLGIIVLHGTDTLAFSAAFLSFMFSDLEIPMVLVSGNRPTDDPLTNANANFKAAVKLILKGLAPNVYATYRNSDGITRLYLGSTLMQCPNFSEDFRSASDKTVFEASDECLFKKCEKLSGNRSSFESRVAVRPDFSKRALLIYPYTGLDYSVYSDCLKISGIFGVVHGSYHSGTVSLPGTVGKNKNEMQSKYSVLYLAEMCGKQGIPLFIAPSKLGPDQYETMAVVTDSCNAILLNMTTEAAYAKLSVALFGGMSGQQLEEYMKTGICNELSD